MMKRRTAFVGTLLLGALALFAGAPALHAQPADAPRIKLQSVSFDPLATIPIVPPALRNDQPTTSSALVLIQFTGPIEEAWKTVAQQAGARFFGYVPDNAFVARLDGEAQKRVQQLPFVRWIGPFHPAYKLAQALNAAIITSNAPITVTIQATPDMDVAAFEQQMKQWNGTLLAHATNEWATYVRATLPSDRVVDVAHRDDVLWVAPYAVPSVLNSVAGGTIMGANSLRASLDLYGRGQVIGIADTGLDMGGQSTLHPDILGRVQATYCLGRPQPCDWSDPYGHGTHVVGSALGNGAASGSNATTHSYGGSEAGVAPEASLVMQSIGDAQGGLNGVPVDAGDLMRQAYRAGARIHSNSWGSYSAGTYSSYTTNSSQVDAAGWEHSDQLVLFAAGNNGVDANKDGVIDPDSLLEQGAAKNVLTVGASESVRPQLQTTWSSGWPNLYNTAPLAGDLVADNANGMAAFSSRGPTDDGRIKPDIVAPGTYILSMRSRAPGAGTGWGVYNNYYVYNGGTSMATPLTAGAAAVTREWLNRMRGVVNPSAALIKALLLNGAASLGSGQYATKPDVPTTRPNSVDGWGRVDLDQTLSSTSARTTWFADNTAGLATNGKMQYTLSIGGAHNQTTTSNSVPANPKAAPALPAATQLQGTALNTAPSLQNGSFERGVWGPWQTYGTPQLRNTVHRTGSWSAHLGGTPNAQDQLIQALTIPSVAQTATLSFWYRSNTAETVADADQACFGVWPAQGTTPVVVRCLDMAQIGTRDWTQEAYTLSTAELAAVQGQPVRVAWYMVSNSTALSEVWVDDVALRIDTASVGQPAANEPIRVMLTWTDYPGQPAAAKALVNDLDLEVIAPNGTHHRGNQGLYPSTHRCMRAGQWDTCNNVEGVTVPFVPGNYTVVVYGANVPQGGRQPYAVVASGDYAQQVFGHAVFVPTAQR